MSYRFAQLASDPTGFVFERICPKTKEYQAIYASALLKHMQARKKFTIEQLYVDVNAVNDMLKAKRVDLMKVLRMPDWVYKKEGLAIHTVTGVDLIDGNHRYVGNVLNGRPFMPVYIAKEDLWRRFIIKDFRRTI